MKMQTFLPSKEKLFPLKLFYELQGRPLPRIEPVAEDDIPYPARQLLVHDDDMTSQLQAFYDRPIQIDVFHKEQTGDSLEREVILYLEGSKKPVEYGAIQIDLSNLPSQVIGLILQCKLPLGAILNENKVPYQSNPKSFFRVRSDAFMIDAFQLKHPYPLYGRCNLLTHNEGNILADVVEILPPIEYLYR